MPSLKQAYLCDICNEPYATESGAVTCEAKSSPEPWPVGMVFQLHGDFSTIRAIFDKLPDGHEWGYTCRISSGELISNEYFHRDLVMPDRVGTKTELPSFARMVAFLRAERPGEPVFIWDGEKAVVWEGEE